jgi:hypothetical protein
MSSPAPGLLQPVRSYDRFSQVLTGVASPHLYLLAYSLLGLNSQYRARPPDMSNTAPVLNTLAAEQSHKTNPATSSTLPRRFSGLAVIIASTTSLPNCLLSNEVGINRARRDTVHANVGVANLTGQGFCEGNYARARRRISCKIR